MKHAARFAVAVGLMTGAAAQTGPAPLQFAAGCASHATAAAAAVPIDA